LRKWSAEHCSARAKNGASTQSDALRSVKLRHGQQLTQTALSLKMVPGGNDYEILILTFSMFWRLMICAF
jgi:hypothetical protein